MQACSFPHILSMHIKNWYSSALIQNGDTKMLINPGKTNSYSEDPQWRMVWQREVLVLSLKTVASNLGVDPCS